MAKVEASMARALAASQEAGPSACAADPAALCLLFATASDAVSSPEPRWWAGRKAGEGGEGAAAKRRRWAAEAVHLGPDAKVAWRALRA